MNRWFQSTSLRTKVSSLGLLQYRAVQVDSTTGQLVMATGPISALGILQNAPRQINADAQVGYIGEMVAISGGAIVAGHSLTINTSGSIVSITTQAASSGPVVTPIGKALESCSSGESFKGIYNFANAASILTS